MSHSNRYSESTRLVHEARQPDLPRTLAPPVQRSSTVLLPSASALYDASHVNYGRGGLATHQALRDALAELEAAERVFLFPSGLAAITGSLQALTSSGDEVLICGSQEIARLSKPYRESKFVQLRASCRVKDQ